MAMVKKEHMFGGAGYVMMNMILDEKQLNGKCRIYAEVTIKQGHELGYHVHQGDAESYFILSGEAEYNDNGVIHKLKPGDSTYTPTGMGHSITNKCKEDLKFMALIIYD